MIDLKSLQQQLIENKLDAYIVTRNNMFLGQDVLPEENKILALTGFRGSAGNLIVFRDRAVLLVDGRYDIQARQQTDASCVEVVCTRDSVGSWIQNNIKSPFVFAYDAWCHSIAEVDFWKRVLTNHEFIEDKHNLLGIRTCNVQPKIFELEERFAGISAEEKISYLSKFCLENHLDAYLLCESDCVSWLMNLRSDLLADTPILRAFALVSAQGEVSLFINDFQSLAAELATMKGKTVGASFGKTPKKIQILVKDYKVWLRNIFNPVTDWKAEKNSVEIAGFRAAHVRDGVAVCRFLHWLEQNWQGQDELSVVEKLRQFRADGEYFYSDSFATIAGCDAHGAIIHYQPSSETNAALESGTLLLIDSGAQYFDGTTDITRTVALGQASDEMKDSYTQVLKAHIAVANALFPPQTPGAALDTLARATLWHFGKDYAHGTGHGVGHFLGVHEGPQSLSLKNTVPLKKNMVVSIEPGFYKENAYGIRLENLALIEEDDTTFDKPMLYFEPLTLVPFALDLLNLSLLSKEEINWLNVYHQKVWQTLVPHLHDDDALWLKHACRAIG
jgi:Xaa-Pro aminopeptidase